MKSKVPVGSLTVLLQFDPYQVQGAHLTVPLLAIDEEIGQFTQYDSIPAGTYPARIVAYLTNGQEVEQQIKVRVLPNQGNLHEFKIHGPSQEVVIRPVDSENRTILFSEIKIENVDLNFRPVRDERGVICKIRPGEYQVQVILPNLSMKSLPLKVTADTQVYTLTIPDRHDESRHDPRIEMSLPVDYKTNDGNWVSTESVNISTGGICIVKHQWSLDDENLVVRLYLPVTPVPVECPATVRWVREEGTNSSRMGIELKLNTALKNTLSKWLAQTAKKSAK